jgi:hypothetical protein
LLGGGELFPRVEVRKEGEGGREERAGEGRRRKEGRQIL